MYILTGVEDPQLRIWRKIGGDSVKHFTQLSKLRSSRVKQHRHDQGMNSLCRQVSLLFLQMLARFTVRLEGL